MYYNIQVTVLRDEKMFLLPHVYYVCVDESDFGQRTPPLIDYIKGILNNYPDGSQILKVMHNLIVALLLGRQIKFPLNYNIQ